MYFYLSMKYLTRQEKNAQLLTTWDEYRPLTGTCGGGYYLRNMKKTISLCEFVAGIIICGLIIKFFISLLLVNVLLMSPSIFVYLMIQFIIDFVAISISSLIVCKRYAIPSSVTRIAIWVALVKSMFVILRISPYALYSLKNLVALVFFPSNLIPLVTSLLSGVVVYFSLNFFSRQNGDSQVSQ